MKMGAKETIILSITLFVSACAADSCSGRCGTFDLNNFDCQCNSECTSYGNCCSDYVDYCNSQATCVGRNCYGDDQSMPCQCNSYCTQYNDCCSDYEAVCVGSCQGRCGPGTDTTQNCQCNSYCQQYGDCCSDYANICVGTGTSSTPSGSGTGTSAPPSGTGCSKLSVSNSDLLSASYNLWSLDENAAAVGDITVNVQGSTTNSATNDVAPDPFFISVNQEVLQRDTFVKLRALQDNYLRTQGNTEVVTDAELLENDAFLDAFLATTVGQYLFNFLDSKNLAGCNGISGFNVILNDIWFGMYDRQATHDTSGFEHAFVGEIKGSGVSGFHNWMMFYYEEQEGNFNYQGYLSKNEDPLIVGTRHTWYGATKPINGFTIGTSPEIEMALFTLCHLSRPGSKCNIQLADQYGNAYDSAIQTYAWTKSYPPGGQSYIASAYFIS